VSPVDPKSSNESSLKFWPEPVPVLVTRNETDVDIEVLVTALGNSRSGAILRQADEPMTAQQLSDACGVPLSTTYRKINRLEAAELLDETVSFDDRGRCVSRYERTFDKFEVEMQHGDIAVRIVE